MRNCTPNMIRPSPPWTRRNITRAISWLSSKEAAEAAIKKIKGGAKFEDVAKARIHRQFQG